MDRSILGASAYGRQVPSVRVRVTQWLAYAQTQGATTDQWTYCDLKDLSAKNLGRNVAKVPGWERRARQLGLGDERQSSLLLHRELSPLSRGSLEAMVIGRFGHSVFDFDDVLHLPGRGRSLLSGAQKPADVLSRCSRVIAGNSVLADWASRFSSDVSIVPSCVDVSEYTAKTAYELNDPPVAVWVGSRSTEPFLFAIVDALDELNQRHGLRICVVGDSTLATMQRPYIDRVQWSEAVVAERIASSDLGLMPLPDTAFTRGKCAYKLLQYGAGALPSLGSPVGVNTRVLAEYGSQTPSTTTEWVDSVSQLLSMSAVQRREIGERSRQVVEAGYSYDAWWGRWRDVVVGAQC